MTEAEFTDEILGWAKLNGWRRFHVRGNTRRLIQGDVGFPDLVLVRVPRVIFAELKVGKNKLKIEQKQWQLDLFHSGVEVYEWRPEEWRRIMDLLKR